MTRRPARSIAAALAAALLALALVAPASGYIEQRFSQVLLSGPNVVRCDRAATITARVVETETGDPVNRQIVRWSLVQTQSSGDALNATSTVTNARGRTSVRLVFGPARGPRVVQARIAGGAPTITVRCRGGLPRTAPVPPPDHVEPAPAMALAPPAIEASVPADAPATAIRMERLGIDLPIVAADGVNVVDGAANHDAATAWPGEGSNAYLYGHAREGQFLELWQVRRGDRVEVDLADGTTAAYEVTEIHPLVAWDAFEYLEPTDREILTLQTCLTYEETAPRFVVIAERVNRA